jgi:enoyl-CoA hydratase
MEFENILLETKENISFITINRPKQLNALNIKTIQELLIAVTKLESDNNIKCVIFTGSESKAFIAGADIKEFSEYNSVQAAEMAENGHTLFNLIENLSKPAIAAINGFALGGGLELALACHIRIASSNAKMGLPEVSLGVIPGYGGTQRLAHLIGKGRAMEMVLTTQMVDANKAMEIGLINNVCSQDELLNNSIKIAEKIKRNSPFALKNAIKSINDGYKYDIDGYKSEIQMFSTCFDALDFKEGVNAFIEKRKPNFN